MSRALLILEQRSADGGMRWFALAAFVVAAGVIPV
jgi:hypothetical protein